MTLIIMGLANTKNFTASTISLWDHQDLKNTKRYKKY